jgi:hypothetical protein
MQPLRVRVKLFLKRSLGPKIKRKLKTIFRDFSDLFSNSRKRGQASSELEGKSMSPKLEVGDRVQIRSREEIQFTLNYWHELKNCGFMADMWKYCGTTQRVLKPVERFVDERDYRVKRVRGVYLLEGVICQGSSTYGRCDRACFFFWREEWLKKIEESPKD